MNALSYARWAHSAPIVRGTAKRALDIAGSALGVALLLPLFFAVGAAIWWDDGGPTFFRQARIGRGGRAFEIWKFRTMAAGAVGSNLAVAGDPRVTRVGQRLRRLKIDELPQFINVLRGEMSLVGPRPETPDLFAHYSPSERAAMTSVRPGLTDYASLLLRDEGALLAARADPRRFYVERLMPFKCEMCLRYIGEMGPLTDLRIILATLCSIVVGRAPEALIDSGLFRRLTALTDAKSSQPSTSAAQPSPAASPSDSGDAPSPASAGLRGLAARLAASFGPLARKTVGLSTLTAVGQLTFVAALPLLSRQYTPADFGLFTIYLSIVNLCGPLVGLKFESALYAASTRRETELTLVLSLLTIAVTTTVALAVLLIFGGHWGGPLGGAVRGMGLALPLGLLLTGLWSASSAWAIRLDAIRTLGAARFVQPAAMTALQLALGFVQPSGFGLIVAHLISQCLYSSLIFLKTLRRRDLVALHPAHWVSVLRHAGRQRQFPLFVLPAQIGNLAVSNLPPVLLSLMYGEAIAGHCGVAYRLVAAPIAIASLPLGAVFTGTASRNPDLAAVLPLARKIILVSLVLVAAPIVLFGVAAPTIAPIALGEQWAFTGQIVAAFAILAAAQSLSTPFTDVTSIFGLQTTRFAVEFAGATMVVAAVVVGAYGHWSPLETIWLISGSAAATSLAGLALIWRKISSATPRGEQAFELGPSGD